MYAGLIIYGSLDTISGGFLYDRMLVERLRQEGDRVEIISLPWQSYPRCLLHNFSATLLRRLSSLPLDVLLQDELNHPSLFLLNARLRRRVRYPIVSIVHHLRSSEARPAWQNRIYRQVERRYLRSADAFIYNSQTTRQVVENLAGARPAVVATPAGDRFLPGIDPSSAARRARQPGPLRLVFLGNLIPRKGLHTLLDALDRLPRGSVSLEVIGSETADPAYAHSLRRQAARLGLEPCVQFLGSLEEDRLAQRLRASHLLVVPSSYEGFGITYLEGMAFGLPAVGATTGAAAEIITHGVDGLLVPPGNPTTLAAEIEALGRDRDRLVALSLGALRRYAAHPTWEATTRQIRRFLLSFTGNCPEGSRDGHPG